MLPILMYHDVGDENPGKDRVTPEEFGSTASAAYQSITELIDRFQRIDAAIVASNAVSMVQTSCGRFTVAGAIALRSRLKGNGIYAHDGNFEDRLMGQMERQFQKNVEYADTKNKGLESQASILVQKLSKETKEYIRQTSPFQERRKVKQSKSACIPS